jgi:hypothetical protein
MSRRRRATRDRRARDARRQTSATRHTRTLFIAAALAVIAFALLPIAAYAYTGYFTRYWADDYCVAAHMNELGLWGSQKYWFTHWTGRFGAVFAVDFITYLGKSAVPFYAGVIIGAWLLALVFACYQVGRVLFGHGLLLQSVLIASVILFCYLKLIPSRDDGLYWLSGGTNYTIPLVLLTLNVGLLAMVIATPRISPVLASIGVFTLAFVASGFAETFIIWQLSLMAITLGLTWGFGPAGTRDQALTLVLRALAGALIAANIVQFASGNQSREQTTDKDSLINAGLNAVADAVKFLPDLVARPETLLAAGTMLVVATLHFARNPQGQPLSSRDLATKLAIALAVTFVLVIATFAPGHYFLSGTPPERAQVSAVLTVIILAIYAGYLGGRVAGYKLATDAVLAERLARYLTPGLVVATILVAAITLPPAVREFGQADEKATYARAWDERDRLLEAAGDPSNKPIPGRIAGPRQAADVTVPLLEHSSGFELRTTPDIWINECASLYYNVRSIVASETAETVLP